MGRALTGDGANTHEGGHTPATLPCERDYGGVGCLDRCRNYGDVFRLGGSILNDALQQILHVNQLVVLEKSGDHAVTGEGD